MSNKTARDRRMPTSRRTLWIVFAVVVIGMLAFGVAFGYQASKVGRSLTTAADQAQSLQAQISDGDQDSARATLKDLQGSTRDANGGSDGPLWGIAGAVPFVGQNVTAVQTVSRVLNELANDGLPPIVDAANDIDGKAFSPNDGRVDVEALNELAPSVLQADTVLTSGDKELTAIDSSSLIGQLQGPVRELQDKVGDAQKAASAASTALKVLPSMLGNEGERRYLTLFQNNAEIRSTGGLPGAFAVVEADGGRLSLGSQGVASEIPVADEPVLELTDEELNLYTNKLGRFFGNSTFTPDFPRTAEIARTHFEGAEDSDVDGVISVDPVALSYILKGTGPVTLADGTKLNSDNAVDLLLNQVYVDYAENSAQDAFFASATKEVFEAVSSGAGNPQEVIKALVKASAERRILVWSGDEDEQKILQETQVSGALPKDTGATPQVGFYLNDGTGAKMQYYLDYEADLKSRECTDDGVQTLTATMKLRSNAPADASQLPKSIIGPGFGQPAGSQLVNLRLYAPAGGRITGTTINGKKSDLFLYEHEGRPVALLSAAMKPGEDKVLSVTMRSGAGQDKAANVIVTPGLDSRSTQVSTRTSCE